MSWQRGDKISYFFAFSFMSLQDRKYFDYHGMTIKNNAEVKRMEQNYPKGKMTPKG